MRYVFLLIMILNCACSDMNSVQSIRNDEQHSLEIEIIDNEIMGCGASLSLNRQDFEKRRYVWIDNMETQKEPFMKMNGKIVYPKYIKTILDQGDSKVGDKSIFLYAIDGGIKMQLEWTITWLCPPDDESCEITYYDVTMTLMRQSDKRVYKLLGAVGC